jgi:hypothetical protein
MKTLSLLPIDEIVTLPEDIYGHKIIQCHRKSDPLVYEPVKVMTLHSAGQKVILEHDSDFRSITRLRGEKMKVALHPEDKKKFEKCSSVYNPNFNVPIDEMEEVRYVATDTLSTQIKNGANTFLGITGTDVANDFNCTCAATASFTREVLRKYGITIGNRCY